MAPIAQAVIVACVVVVSVALVVALVAIRKSALRAESLVQRLEREITPMLGQLESLAGELRDLSKHADQELGRISVVVHRAEDVFLKVSRLVGAIAGLTRLGQYASLAAGVKKGVDVFVGRLKAKS